MAQTWNDAAHPWQSTDLPWKNQSMPWNDTSLPWKQDGANATLATPTLDLDAASDSGSSSTDNLTNDTTPDLTATFPDGLIEDQIVYIEDNGVKIDLGGTNQGHDVTAPEASGASIALGLSALTAGSHSLRLWYTSGDGTDFSDKSTALVITVDTTAATLSSATGAEDTDTSADISVSTNKAGGTVYGVVTASSSPPSAADIIAGTVSGGLSYGSAAVSGTGAQPLNVTGLTTAGTRYAHFAQVDAAGNISSVATSSGWAQTGSASLTPLDIFGSDLVAWYRADTGVYVDAGSTLATDGQTVQQWSDLSGNGYHLLQATSGKRPTYNATGFNGRKTITFNAASQTGMATSANTVAFGTGAQMSGFGVGQMLTGTSAYGSLLSYLNQGGGTGQDHYAPGSARILGRQASNNAICTFRNNAERSSEAISLATDYRLGTIYNGTNSRQTVNNAAGSTSAITVAFETPGTLAVGMNASLTTDSWWSGPCSEVVLLKVAPTTQQALDLDNYFKSQWGL